MYATQIVGDEERRCFVTSLSPKGLYLDALSLPWLAEGTPVQIELRLPGEVGEPIWALGEVLRGEIGLLFDEVAVRFTAIAEKDTETLVNWLKRRKNALTVDPVAYYEAA